MGQLLYDDELTKQIIHHFQVLVHMCGAALKEPGTDHLLSTTCDPASADECRCCHCTARRRRPHSRRRHRCYSRPGCLLAAARESRFMSKLMLERVEVGIHGAALVPVAATATPSQSDRGCREIGPCRPNLREKSAQHMGRSAAQIFFLFSFPF